MYLLAELWKGNVTPDERAVQEGSPYQKIHRESVACMERFRKELSPEGKKALDEFFNKEMELADISEQDAFVRGVRIGARFILDVIGEYRSQLPQVNEFL